MPTESDFIDDIVQDKVPTHIEPPRDNFLPWHRVKKEYVRRFQWDELTVRMLRRFWQQQLQHKEDDWSSDDAAETREQLKLPKDISLEKTLKCLMIPGDDLLDVRALWQDVQKYKCEIRYLGFNESQGSNQENTRVYISNNAVVSLPHVSKDSCVVHDRFESISKSDSQAYRYLKQYGPYHVINLDLCGTIFPNTVKDVQQYYEALHQLLIYQFKRQTTEWLLFITTAVEPSLVHKNGFEQLCITTTENFHAHTEFADRIGEIVPKEAFKDPKCVDLSSLTEPQMVQLFGIALGKWLLALCQDAKPKWTLAMRRSFCYPVNEEKGMVLLSLAFELKPNTAPPTDPTGMSKLKLESKEYPDERECALQIVESTTHIADVDAMLKKDPKLKEQLRDSQAEMLEAAGYDKDAYIKWVATGEVVRAKK